ncbi:MAG: hypothetical protein CMO55_23135 [Verrucomicrobiales bacterium]|nr:hypothetical protein [Verrucomicrobiales bacterium]
MKIEVQREAMRAEGAVLFPDDQLRLVRFTCCGNFGIEEVEDKRVFYDPGKLKSFARKGEEVPCQICGADRWEWEPVEEFDPEELRPSWARLISYEPEPEPEPEQGG